MANTRCADEVQALLRNPAVPIGGAAGGRLFVDVSTTVLCTPADGPGFRNSTRRREQLPAFMRNMHTRFNVSVDLLFGQPKAVKDGAGIKAYIPAVLKLLQAAAPLPYVPALRFDVEYDPTPTDTLRVLDIAHFVRQTVDAAPVRPAVSWSVDTAAAFTYTTACPAASLRGHNVSLSQCFFAMVDTVNIMDYRSFAVQEPPPKTSCDGLVVRAAPFFADAAAVGKRVAVGIECGCDPSYKYQYKISFCAAGQRNHTADPYAYMLSSLVNTTAFLANTSAALSAYPCAADPGFPVAPLTGGRDLWTAAAAADASFVVEDLTSLAALAGNAGIGDWCPASPEWTSCV